MKKIIFGIVVIATGMLMLGFNTGYLDSTYKHVVFSWQMLLIAMGFISLFGRDSFLGGIVLIGVGTFFIIPEVQGDHYNLRQYFWPVVLILIGVLILFKRIFFQKKLKVMFKQKHDQTEGVIEEVNVFGGTKRKIITNEFRGGEMVNVFGGGEFDLSEAKLSNEKNTLEVVCVFGGLSMIVPSDWIIHVEVISLFGGFADKRPTVSPGQSSGKTLYIKGVCIFGGGEIKSSFNTI